jgi:EmrB/QacA subfamily drug resistance transporter
MVGQPARAASTGGWAIPLIVLIVGSFMSVLDTSIVNVAIPHIQTELGASADDVEWIVTGYTLALGVIVPLSGWLGLRLGLTTVYIMSLVGFAVASGLCGLAWNLDVLIGFRVLQAVPGGVLPVVTMTMLYQIVPRDKIGTAMGMYGLGVVVAPAVGPTLGGYLVQYIDWRLIFYINVPIGILGTIAALAVFPRIHPSTWPKFDLWGFVTVAYGLFALLLAFSKAQKWGWTGYRVEMLIVSGLLSLALFVVIELEAENPLINVRVFKSWPFTNSLLLIAITTTGMFTTLYFIPQFLQVTQGLQALPAGVVLLPSALVLVVLMPIAGQLYDRIGARWPAVIGLLLMAYGQYLLAHLTADTPQASIVLWTSVRNLGTGLAMMPIMTAGIAALPTSLTSSGSAMNNVAQRVSSSVAVAVFGGLIASQQAQLLSDRGGLLGSNVNSLPQLQSLAAQGQTGFLAIYQQLQKYIAAETYANAFLIVSIMCAGGALLALMLRSGPPQAAPAETAPAQPAPAPAVSAATSVPVAAQPVEVLPAAPAPEPAAPEHHRSARHLVPHGRHRSRHHFETFEETEARRNEEAAKAASGIHL